MTLPNTRNRWPEDAVEAFEERAGIMEHVGMLPRADAERRAEECVRMEWARKVGGNVYPRRANASE